MATLAAQIEDVVGTVPSGLDVDNLLGDGCKDIVRRISLTNPEDLWKFTTNTAVPDSGLSIGTSKLYDVTRDKKPCSPIPAQMRHRASEADSIHFASAEFPVYYLINGKCFVLPEPGESDEKTIAGFTTYDSGARTQIECNAHGFTKGDYITINQSDEVSNNTY